MKTIAKFAVGALMACGVAVAAAAPAEAGVHVGIGIGVPVGPAYGATCYDNFGRPFYCGYPAAYGPGYIGVGGYWGGHGYWGGRGYGYGRGFHPGFHGGFGGHHHI